MSGRVALQRDCPLTSHKATKEGVQNMSSFSTCCALVSEEGRVTARKFSHPFPFLVQQFPPPLPPPDIFKPSDTSSSVFCCLFYFFSFCFSCVAIIFATNLKLYATLIKQLVWKRELKDIYAILLNFVQ